MEKGRKVVRNKKVAGDDDVPLSGAPHARSTASDPELSSQNVSESSVIIPHFPPALSGKC
jgi:hypothetical protein